MDTLTFWGTWFDGFVAGFAVTAALCLVCNVIDDCRRARRP